MPFREMIARIALADARRFEAEAAAMLREILAECGDERTRGVLREILAEEEAHFAQLTEAVPAARAESLPAEEPPLPKAPGSELPRGDICRKLRAVLRKEEGSATFYKLLAERTKIPSARNIFQTIAEQERGHAERLREHIDEICKPEAAK